MLPKQIVVRLVQMAAQNGFSIADYLDGFVASWRPDVALSGISEACLDDAKKLRAALLPAVQRMDSILFSAADRVRLGLADYKREVGHEVSERHWQRLLARTLWRDGGMEDFQRLEIYLQENPACNADAKRLRQDKLAEQKQAAVETSRARKSFKRLGMAAPGKLRPGQVESASRLAEILKDDESDEAEKLPAKSLTQKDGQFTYHLKPSGDDKTKYVDYLITRLTEFRKAGKSFGQHFAGAISFGVTRTITQSQIGGNIYAPGNFEAVCAHLKEKIDATILGKRNLAKGAPNYHVFAAAQETL